MRIKFHSILQTRYVIATVLTIVLIMLASSYYETKKGHEELFQLMQKEAYSLIESVERSSNIVITSSDQLEQSLNERLFNIGYFIANLDSKNLISQDELKRICSENNIHNVSIFDKSGKLLLNSDTTCYTQYDRKKTIKMLNPILTGEQNSIIIGIQENQSKSEGFYSVAIRRMHRQGGAILLSIDVKDISQLRASVGIGKLMKDIGDNIGVEYALLQDTIGIIAASKDIDEISSIESEDFLKTALLKDTVLTRIILYKNKEIFEVVKPLLINEETIGLIRIGLSMDELHAMESRMKERIFVVSLVIVVLVILATLLILINQNLKITQKKIKDVETFTSNILEQMQDAVITLDNEQRIIIFNKQAENLFGINANSIIGKPINEVESQCLKEVFQPLNVGIEKQIVCADGQEWFISVAVTKSESSTTAVIRNMTETRRLQQEIMRREKLIAMGELAAKVAHEIRNPLSAISMIAQRYKKEFKPARNLVEYNQITSVLLKESRRINNIIEQFLKFARPSRIACEETTAGELINHVANLFEAQAKSKKIYFNYNVEGNGTIKIDINQMTQALLNLLQNALDATPEGGRISLKSKRTDDSLVLEVEDTGLGILPNMLDKIFDLYYTTKPNGTGMGLAITQQIVNQHNGKIKVKSKFGSGTTFTVEIPIEPTKSTPEKPLT